MLKNKYFLIILLIFLLFIIPSTSASDNNNDLIEIDNENTIFDNNFLKKVDNNEDIASVDANHKELTDDDLKNDSVIYLTNGEYDYKQEYEHRNITFIGENTSKTIINGNGSTIHITEFLSFNNLTLKNIKIYAPENLTAKNVIFKDFKYTYSEDFPRGMIYNDYTGSSNINLVDCTFYNNTLLDAGILEAYYSTINIKDSKIIDNENVETDEYIDYGIIYAYQSILNISSCEFINNKVGSSSGVLTCKISPINITNSTFVNNTSKTSPCIRESNGDASIVGCEFINNTATSYGSIYTNGGNLYISHCEFINNSAEKRGGSICFTAYDLSNFTVDNCNFYDSKAKLTGGSIHISGGNINIKDCNFNNSQATSGGAIFLDNSYMDSFPINIISTDFINCSSTSKGGAIYCIGSNSFNGSNLSIINAKSRYGAGIFTQDCDSTFNNLTITNSSSISGAYLHQNGNLKLIDSIFSANTAAFGSAIYLTDMQNVLIENNTFKNNDASGYGSAIYIVSNSTQEFPKNNYENNTAKDNKTIYVYYISYDKDNLIIISRNYTFFIGNYTDTDYIPPYYNLVDLNQTTSVKDQGNEGNCWAFAAIGGLESNILKAYNLLLNLSENNMKNIASNTSPFGWTLAPNDGGYSSTHTGYLVSWLGPVLEEDDPYIEISRYSDLFDSVLHVQNILNIKRDNFTDNDEIKKAIMKYGGVVSGIYSTNSVKQYYNESINPNHKIVIVGWNDTMEIPDAPGLGAWICKNSWGPNWGEEGYLYVSYYDTSCPSNSGFLDAYIIIFNSTIEYEKNYQYDQAQTTFIKTESDSVWYKNKFNATNNELLAGVSTYFKEDTFWDLSVYVNDDLKLSKSGFSKSGYWTIELGEFIPLEIDDSFEIEFKINRQNASVPICEGKNFVNIFYSENISFISFDGENWTDLYDYDWNNEGKTALQVACIKAFTVLNNETFMMLSHQIENHENYLEFANDYTYTDIDEEFANGIVIIKDNFTIDGKGHTINGAGLARIFNITANNVTLKNINFINGNGATNGGAIYSTEQITLNNVTFINNNAILGGAIYSLGQITLNNATFINNNASYGGSIAHYDNIINCNNSRFIDNNAREGPSLYSDNATINIHNTFVTSCQPGKYGQIYASSSTVNIENMDFVNISSTYSPALYLEDCENSIINSRFVNLTANMSAGAIAIRWSGNSYIKGCEFINTKSFKNAGAILIDYGMRGYESTILDCVFDNTSSMIGGAYIQLGGYLFMTNSNFTNNNATYDGGAVYISFAITQINDSIFDSNGVELLDDYPTYGGAIYSDFSVLKINNSNFTNNSAYLGNAIYARDSFYEITDCLFANNTNAIYTDFDDDSCNLDNNRYNGDSVITNQSYNYQTFIDSPVLNLTLTNNTINVTGIPCRFDLRDWGCITPVKSQNRTGACWTFAMMSALESSLLKSYGIEFYLSENNMFNNEVRYSTHGFLLCTEAGSLMLATSYLLSWHGPILEEADCYDEVGRLSPFPQAGYDVVHIQDVIILRNDDAPESSKIKTAILNYGALAVSYYMENDNSNGYYNPKTYAQYIDEILRSNHGVSVIGWDDNFSKDNFIITPPGDGAWIAKNSWGTDWGDDGIFYISYYDKTITSGEFKDYDAIRIVIENTIPYNKNYQHDFLWLNEFIDMDDLRGVNGNITYANQFESAGDDLIAAVGTYFNESGVNYTVEIYVNDELKLTQEGISPFRGYHTIKLNEYVPIKTGDIFKAVMTSNTMPCSYCSFSRVHYTENVSFFYYEDEWVDLYAVEDYVACLKIYTVCDDTKIINNNDIAIDYGSGECFNVKVVTADGHSVSASETVKFTINGKNITTLTDDDGIAKFEITEVPGTYVVTTTYNGQTYQNNVTVKLNLSTCKVIGNKNMKVYYNGESYFTVKVVSADGKVTATGAPIKFTINGKTTTVKTDENGIAKIKITEIPGTYIIKTTFNDNTYTNTITVIPNSINGDNTPDENHKSDDMPTYSSQPVYTLYCASDMKIICHSNIINLKALMDLFKLNLTNVHLKVYVDGTLVFDGDVNDDLSKAIFKIIEKFLGKHEITLEFTDNNGNTHNYNETVIIE